MITMKQLRNLGSIIGRRVVYCGVARMSVSNRICRWDAPNRSARKAPYLRPFRPLASDPKAATRSCSTIALCSRSDANGRPQAGMTSTVLGKEPSSRHENAASLSTDGVSIVIERDQAKRTATLRRRIPAPTMPKPPIIIIQVADSGTEAMLILSTIGEPAPPLSGACDSASV